MRATWNDLILWDDPLWSWDGVGPSTAAADAQSLARKGLVKTPFFSPRPVNALIRAARRTEGEEV